MKWTRQPPVEPGWYWMDESDEPGTDPWPTPVERSEGLLVYYDMGYLGVSDAVWWSDAPIALPERKED